MRVITAPDITVSDKLKGIIDNLGPQGFLFFNGVNGIASGNA